MATRKSKMIVLKDYFGFLPGQTLRDFSTELKALSSEERSELAQGAARNMGLTQDHVDFTLEASPFYGT